MKKVSRKFKIVSLFAIVLSIFGISFAISADSEAGKIILTKEASKVSDHLDATNEEYGRIANVTLTVGANPYTEKEATIDKLDIILVLDSSGSMRWTSDGKETQNDASRRITALKETATSFVNTMLDKEGKVQIGIVEYDDDVKQSIALTSNKNALITAINDLEQGGATNIQSGIAETDKLLDSSRSDAKKLIIILTDGIPTKYNYKTSLGTIQCGDGNDDKAGDSWICPANLIPSDSAKIALDALKLEHKTTDVYTITFGNEPNAAQKLAKINPASAEKETPIYKNVTALTASDLKKEFENIQEATKNIIGRNSTVIDIIPAQFQLTEKSKIALTEDGIIVQENEDGSTTLTWNIGTIEAGNDRKKTLSYDVVAKDDYHGSIYTNSTTNYESATLTTTVDENNPYYKNESSKDLTLRFASPVANIPAITNDDHYNDNSSYVTTAETTMNASTILNNDFNKNLTTDKETKDTSLSAMDEIIVVENTNTVKIANNTYQIKDSTTVLGTLTMNEDGTFQFISAKNISGEVTFNYYIKTTITKDEETSDLYSNTSTVTLKIVEREKITISGTKIWEDANNQDGIRKDKITVVLKANGKIINEQDVGNDTNWMYEFKDLYKYEDGHEGNDLYAIKYTVEEKTNIAGYKTTYQTVDGKMNIINTHVPETINISGQKTWEDANNQDGMRPTAITIRLQANGEEVAVKTVTAKENWTYEFTNMPKYLDGQVITYTISEDAVEGYEGIIDGMNITNKHIPVTISIHGEKIWVDENNMEGLRPEEITIRLLADGKEVATTKTTSANNWKYSFNDLPQYKTGKEIIYTVTEDKVKYYETSMDKDNEFIIVNTHNPKKITVSGTKTWIDTNNMYGRPTSITVTLTGKVKDKIVVQETKQVTREDNWKYTFTNLPEYKEGILVVYTIDEEEVKDYDKSINGYDITNTYNPETVDITGTKTWSDNDNQDGIRPESIMINLLANGKIIATTQATKESNWTFTFKDQVVYANGEKITYATEEVSVEGYKSEINGFNITNHHTPQTVSYEISKVWLDQDNNDCIRPTSITIHLLSDGKEIATKVIDEEKNWTYVFTNLPKYRDGGVEIKYQIIEDEVKGYTPSIETSISKTDKNVTNVVITNSHENEKVEITVNKTWIDFNNELQKRPTSITVTLIGKVGSKTVVTENVKITEEMNWTYTFENCNKYLDREEITYQIIEKEVTGYTAFYDGYNITNALKEEGEIIPPNTGIIVDNQVPVYDVKILIALFLVALGVIIPIAKRVESK